MNLLKLVIALELVLGFQVHAQTNGVPHLRSFDFILTTLQGDPVPAYLLWSKRPASIVIGSYTCPEFRKKIGGFDALQREFSNRVDFLVLYVQEAHPSTGSSPYPQREAARKQNELDHILIPQPKTAQERTEQARLCAAALRIQVPVLVDGMDNAGWHAFGDAPNSAFLILPGGRAVEQEKWFNASKMREAINKVLNSN